MRVPARAVVVRVPVVPVAVRARVELRDDATARLPALRVLEFVAAGTARETLRPDTDVRGLVDAG